MHLSKQIVRNLATLGLTAGLCLAQAQNQTGTAAGSATKDQGTTGTATSQDSQTRTGTTEGGKTDRNTTGTTSSHGADHTGTANTPNSRNRTDSASTKEMMVGNQDAMFIKEAAMGGMMEVQAAQTAQQKASSAEVKEFAKKLEQDHTKANEELKALAMRKGIDLPSDMGPKHQAHIAKMQNANNFDRTWLKMQADHHKKDVASFQKQSNRSMDSDVKAFAEKTLPTLQGHLQEVQRLSASVK